MADELHPGGDQPGDDEPTVGSAIGVDRIGDLDEAQLSVTWTRRGGVLEVELAGTALDSPEHAPAAAEAIRDLRRRSPGHGLQLAADHPPDRWRSLPEAVAAELGLAPSRLLFQMRRPLPIPADDPIRHGSPNVGVRPIEPGDDDAWIRVNNRAFASHPDQGSETPETLSARRSEGWYDPAGFLVLDDDRRPGELAGFCWTKSHEANGDDPALGEIYVIGVDPSRHGEGLGRALVLAGLDHLASTGIGTANLYVEANNEAAVVLYERLDFAVHLRRRVSTP